MTVSESRRPSPVVTTPGPHPARGRLARALSPTTARYVLLFVTLALAGAFAGQLVHNLVFGMSWATETSRCLDEAQRVPGTVLDQAQWSLRCQAPVQRRLALTSLAGSAAVLLLGLTGLRALPRILLYKAGPLRAVSADWQEPADRVAREMGVMRAPRLAWGGKRVQDAFTVRRRGRHLIILPERIRLLREPEAEAVIRHEMGHVTAGDVTLVWLTRGMWYALLPVLLAAPLLHAVHGMRSREATPQGMISQPLWAEYGVRSLVLAVIAALIAQMITRSREHEADLTAVHGQSVAPWEVLLGEPQPRRDPLSSARAAHPTHQRRLDVLRDPRLYMRPTVLDTIAVGLLTAVLVDAVNQLAGLLLTGTGWSSAPIAALAAGLFLTFGWGTTAWQAGGDRQEGFAPMAWWLLPTLGVSTAVGLFLRLRGTGAPQSGIMQGWPPLVTLSLAVMGAAALSSAFAGLRNVRAKAGRGTLRGRLPEIIVGTLLFSGALWLALDFIVALRIFRQPDVLSAALLVGPRSPSSAHKAVALAAIAVLAAWAWACSPRRSRLGRFLPASAAAVATLAAAATRLVSQPRAAGDWSDVWRLDVLTAVCAAAVCAVTLVVLQGSGGLGHALYAAPLAATLTTTVLWAARFTSWAHPFDAWATVLVESALSGTGLVLLALAVPGGLLPSWATERRTVTIALQVLTAVMAALTVLALQRSADTLLLR